MEPDWSLLPPEINKATIEKITSLADYIRFRAVCHPWRSATSPRPVHLPVQFPWLMLPHYNGSDQPYYSSDSTLLFYDLSSSKIHRLDLPEIGKADICGSSHGWLFLHDGKTTSLLNPLTHAAIPFPPYTAPPATFMPDDDDDEHVTGKNDLKPTKRFRVHKAMLTSSPLDPSCLVFVTISITWPLAFCRIGDECWTVIKFKMSWHFEMDKLQDICYSNGFLWTLDCFANFTVYNMNNPSKTSVSCYIGPDHVHLVDGTSDDILFMEYRKLDGVLPKETECTVYKLSIGEEPKIVNNVIFPAGKCRALFMSTADLQ